MNGSYKIPHFGLDRQYRNLSKELLDATHRVLSSGTYMDGHYTEQFENWLCMRTGYNYAVTLHSGTQALECIAHYEMFKNPYDFKPIARIPNITYVATLNAFLNAGFECEIADTDKNGLLIEEDIDWNKPKHNIFEVHVGLYGASPIYTIGALHKRRILDGAQHWLIHKNIYLDTTPMAVSFDPTKNLPSSGNGGAVLTNDDGLANFALKYRSNFKGEHTHSGTNSRMSEQDCAQILVRTRYIDDWQERRREIRNYYLDKFENLPIRCLSRNKNDHADQKFVIYTEWRDELYNYLWGYAIDVRIHYKQPLSNLEVARYLKKPDMISTSVMLCRGVLSLPIHPELTDGEVEFIADRVVDYFTESKLSF